MNESIVRGEHIVIVGAGIAGLAAARALLELGHTVEVLEKGRGVGGRMATRRIGDATFDHGAQFFTVRGDDFRATVDTTLENGVVDVWCHGFGQDDGYPRYYCPGGMTGLAKWLAAQVRDLGGSITTESRVVSLRAGNDGWTVETHGGTRVHARDVILTSPVPQSIDLLEEGDIALPRGLDDLRSMTYKSVLAVLARLDRAPAVPEPGGVQQTEDDLFTFVSDNVQKGVSAVPAVTLHANGAFSCQRWDDDRPAVLRELLDAAVNWFGEAQVVEAQIHAWRYAAPMVIRAESHAVVATSPGLLLLAGEAFAGPKVEGSFNSGLAAARHVSDQKNGLT